MKTDKGRSHEVRLKELLHQALETERGGVKIYRMALSCVQNSDLREEWEEYLAQTEHHVEVLSKVLKVLDLESEPESGKEVVKHIGESLVEAMELAKQAGDPAGAELVAAECVVLAETKDHMNWHLIGKLADELPDEQAEILRAAHDEVEPEEDEHLYHGRGWARELWLSALGLAAILPPPEETEDVRSAFEAAEAEAESEAKR
jgi:rubrerythrin